MSDVKSFMRRSKASAIVFGIIMLLLGLWVLIFAGTPSQSNAEAINAEAILLNQLDNAVFLSTLTGWGLMIAGCISCVGYGVAAKENRSIADIILGVILVLLGLLAICFPLKSWGFVVIFLGALVFLSGCADIAEAISFKKEGQNGWLLFLIFGIITLLFGLASIITPWWFTDVLIFVLGFALVFDGVTEIIAGVRM